MPGNLMNKVKLIPGFINEESVYRFPLSYQVISRLLPQYKFSIFLREYHTQFIIFNEFMFVFQDDVTVLMEYLALHKA
ncbi:UNVERIFIED_CONTAM: hypothetical protein NCL1_25649 [Trichonephila clavipes]